MKAMIASMLAVFALSGCATYHQAEHLAEDHAALQAQTEENKVELGAKLEALKADHEELKAQHESVVEYLQTLIEMHGERG